MSTFIIPPIVKERPAFGVATIRMESPNTPDGFEITHYRTRRDDSFPETLREWFEVDLDGLVDMIRMWGAENHETFAVARNADEPSWPELWCKWDVVEEKWCGWKEFVPQVHLRGA